MSDTRKIRDGTDVEAMFSALLVTFEEILASRSESVAGVVLRSLPVSLQNMKIVRAETGLKISESSSLVTHEQCTTLVSCIQHFTDHLPRMTLAERFEVLVRGRAQRCMIGKSTLRVKRRGLWALSRLQIQLQQWQPVSAAQLGSQQFFLSCILHEPNSRIRSLWREHLFWFQFNYARRLLHLENRAESTNYLDGFVWPDKHDYYQVIRSSNASRVLLSIHMGDFFGAFRVLSAVSVPGREAISLRRDTTVNHGMQHFSTDRVSHRVLFHQQHQSAAIVSALRRGGHTLATLFDLREDFGSTVTVDFFGHPARFVKGPAQLAIMGRSPIYAFVSYEHLGRNYIEMAPVIDTRIIPGESLQHATVRITQALVKLAEDWIRRRPAQWKYLSSLPAYFEALP